MKIALLYNKENDFNDLPHLIYETFNRDIKNFVDIGFNIPVFFYDINKEFNLTEDIIICLIDDKFVLNKKKFLGYYNNEISKKFIFISYTENYSRVEEIAHLNYIDGKEENKIILNNILYEIARYVFGIKKLKLFLSYKRTDESQISLEKIRNYIFNHKKINTFLDIFSIEYGENFEEEIKKEIQNSVLVSFWSDNYTQSEWCKNEVLFARQYNIPIIVIDCLKNKDINSFSYMFNTLVLECSLDEEEIIKEILLETIRFFNNKIRLKKFKENYALKEFYITPKRVEALDLLHNNTVLYPDPPIGKYEKEFLRGEFITPTEYFTKLNLNKKIAISVSETNNFDNGVEIEHLQDIVIELVRFLMLSSNQIIYGGDIKYSLGLNFAEIIFDLALKYSTKKPTVINPLPIKFYNKINDSVKANYIDIIEFKKVSDNLSEMRKYMSSIEDARIIIGGKLEGYQGKYPGVLEEAYYTLQAKKPLYIIGAFGGVAKEIVKLRNGEEIEQWKNFEIYNDIKTLPLNNGLSKEENNILFYSKDVDEIIKIIMKGLKNEA